jgi:succinate dehydrogenase/fumarate reductase flavoprotein subunit
MAGLAAAARAAESGAEVAVVEKGPTLGGSAALSAGILWTAPDFETLREVVPGGDPELGRALVDGFEFAVEWIRSTGAFVSERWEGQFGFGSAVRVEMQALFEAWRHTIERRGCVLLRTAGRQLVVDSEGRIRGARVQRPQGADEIRADSVVLATGGFQGDSELLATFIGAPADSMLVRSNPWSVGDGFRLGRAVGAAASRCLGGFYGHLVPSPLPGWSEEHFLPLTQYYSRHALLVNRLGRRFTDESLGDEVSNQATLRQPDARAVLICDHAVRIRHAAAAPYPHGQVVDRIAAAEAAGGRFARADTLDQVLDTVTSWGVVRHGLTETLESWMAGAASVDAPRQVPVEPPHEPPYYALEVQPTITFPFGGLAVDADGRVLDRDGATVPGLFAVGADAGGLQDGRYVGGLVLGAVFGPRVAEAALGAARSGVPTKPASWGAREVAVDG